MLEGKSDKPIRTSLDLFREIYGGWRSTSGTLVNFKTAVQVSAFIACARLIGNGLAQVPLKLLKESDDGRKRSLAKDHPLYSLLHRKPNFFQTAFEYRKMIGMHLVVAGSHYSFINRVRGEVYELLPFEPQHVTVKIDRRTYKKTFIVRYEDGGEALELPAESVWHLKGLTWDGYCGLESLKLAQNALGLSIATEDAHANMHRNGAQVGGLISVDGTLTDEKYRQMRTWLEKYFEGVANKNAGRTMILDRGAKFTASQQTGVDAQHLETRRYQVEEVCRHVGVLPIMVGYSDKATTYASAEQQFLAHVVHTMAAWYEMVEQSVDAFLLTEKDRKAGIFAKHIIAGLLRGSLKDTKDYLTGMVAGGLMTQNEGRAVLDLDADDDQESDKLHMAQNVMGKEPEGDEKPPNGEDPDKKSAPSSVQVVFGDGAIKVSAPKVTVQPANVEVKAYLPEGPAPEVHVHPQIEVKAPDVLNVTNVAPAEVKLDLSRVAIISMPARKSESVTERDDKDRITKVKQTERDG